MISNESKKVLILTYNLNLNQTSSKRYLSFVKAISAQLHLDILAVGIRFPFKSHPINPEKEDLIPELLSPFVKVICPESLNPIQKLLVFSDRKGFPYAFKKILLALHIIVYRTDQWCASQLDLSSIDFVPDIVISGGSGGIIKTSYDFAKKHGAKLILDYRDPWNFGYNLLETSKSIYYFKRFFTKEKELSYLNHADKIITVSESLKSFFPKEIQKKTFVIENGGNFEDFAISEASAGKTKGFLITYLGTIYDEQLADERFFAAVYKFIEIRNLQKEDIRFLFLGSIKNTMLPKLVSKYRLSPFVHITARRNYEELLEDLSATRIFLHLKYGDRSEIISSKQADYLMLRRPILLPATDHGDLAESILNNKAGYVCDGKEDSIVNVLQLEYDKFIKGEDNLLKDRDLSHLSRAKIAEKLVELLS